jgi:hypothetical protein
MPDTLEFQRQGERRNIARPSPGAAAFHIEDSRCKVLLFLTSANRDPGQDQLDQLEVRGYLNPGDRGTRADECEAIASFLTDALAKSR